IRHGAADRDPAVPYESPPGPGLSERGRYEVREAAIFLAGRGVRHLYVSPFRRAHQTAEQIGEQLGLPVTVRGLLTEARRAESARCRAFLDSLVAESLSTVGLVSHGTPLLMLRAELCGETVDIRPPIAGQSPLPQPQPTAGIWRVWRDGAGWRAELVFAPSEA